MTADREILRAGHPVNNGCCSRCARDRFVIAEGRNARGLPTYPFVCAKCGNIEAQYAKKAVAKDYARRFGSLRRVVTSTEQSIARGTFQPTGSITEPCEVCGAVGATQEHHWAPWHIFGDEAERWPKSWLCQSCHTRWHQLVTPNMGSGR